MRVPLIATIFVAVFLISSNLYAETSTSTAEISKKLEQILENQKKILLQLEEIKKEVYVVKIRATQR